ncbi:ABC transporter ATP-binding protein [Altererythrobacter sp. FM1]|uniref:ABC-F family ATP-binding cassette domain-containing protein n=1 Tax=Tsuneonella flava TaxID=2055955 RepID=UPI000C7FE6F7|nr:ABC-F family ATP-binding cassette domain-containing protein [Tsuneonella flava]ROT95008.1 ABC transporter ATP-binding protein [Altererythrobacter sp. FM1]
MSPSISLSNLAWSTPDGTPLFANLNLTFGAERTGIVGRNGVGKSTLLQLIAGDMQPAAGRISLSCTFAMMRQSSLAHPDDTLVDLFGARTALDLLDRAERGVAEIDELADADWDLPTRLEAALHKCDLSVDPRTPLATLSGGQQTRAALAAMIVDQPDFLLLDEPTNNLDRTGRPAVHDLLDSWRGGAIVVSHDRELLETMDAIVELTSLGVTRYGGNYTAYEQRKALDLDAAARDLAHAEKVGAAAARHAQQAVERKARKDSAGRKSRAKGGQPKILMDAAKERAEASGGVNARLRETRRDEAAETLIAAREKIEVLRPLHMDMPTTGLVPGRGVLRFEGVSGGYDPTGPIIHDLSFAVHGAERIAICGPNGSGKSTLLKLATGQLTPLSGKVRRFVQTAMLDQHVGLLARDETFLNNYRRLHPAADPHTTHAALARFGFRATDATRIAGSLSGGERLRAGLACTLGATPVPMLLIPDEPTNHLDLDAIAALEKALSAYDGAMLVVSHDQAFINSLNINRTIELPGSDVLD